MDFEKVARFERQTTQIADLSEASKSLVNICKSQAGSQNVIRKYRNLPDPPERIRSGTPDAIREPVWGPIQSTSRAALVAAGLKLHESVPVVRVLLLLSLLKLELDRGHERRRPERADGSGARRDLSLPCLDWRRLAQSADWIWELRGPEWLAVSVS